MSDSKSISVRVTGEVQGVSFRDWTRREARGLGLSGSVRNEADGSVTVVLSGPPERVDAMVGLLHHGPPSAKVDDITISLATRVDGTFRVVS